LAFRFRNRYNWCLVPTAVERKQAGLNRFVHSTEVRLVVGFFVLLYLVGGGLIALFYGWEAALLGMACMTTGLLFFLLLYAIVSLLGRWAGD
jgi:hypothetical protein